jgi:hypothetical protein
VTTLYEMGAEFSALHVILTESAGEWTEDVEARFAALGELDRDKVDAYHAVITNLTAHAAGCQDEAQRLQEKAKIATTAAQRLKDRMKEYMELRGVTALQGDRWRAVIQKNGGKPPLVLDMAVDDLPSPFVRYTPTADTEMMRAKALKDGRVIAGEGVQVAHIDPPGTHLRFR